MLLGYIIESYTVQHIENATVHLNKVYKRLSKLSLTKTQHMNQSTVIHNFLSQHCIGVSWLYLCRKKISLRGTLCSYRFGLMCLTIFGIVKH